MKTLYVVSTLFGAVAINSVELCEGLDDIYSSSREERLSADARVHFRERAGNMMLPLLVKLIC